MYLNNHKKAMLYWIFFKQSYIIQAQMKKPAARENGSLLTTIPGNTRVIITKNKKNNF